MPDIPNRPDREAQLETLLRRAIGRTRQELIDALGDPPNVNNIPESLWQQIRQDVQADTQRVIAIILLLSIRRMNNLHGDDFTMSPADAAKYADEYAAERATTLADSVVDTFKDRLRTVTGDETKSPAEMKREARRIGEEQAKVGGVTETTAANSAGELAYADDYEDETGVKLVATWNCESDACDICFDLDGLEEDEWRDDYPDGPADQHPNCRCWLTFEPAEVLDEAEA